MFSLGRLALLPNGLRAKFIAAFACMSILPLLVCVYIILTFVFPFSESLWLTSTILLLTMLIAYCGFHLMDEIVNSIIALSRTARRLVPHAAAGLQAHPGGDEVTAIKQSLSTLAEDVERKTLKMRQLETTDEKIGIFTERHLRALLVEELKRAALYQRPCAFVVVRFKSRPRHRPDPRGRGTRHGGGQGPGGRREALHHEDREGRQDGAGRRGHHSPRMQPPAGHPDGGTHRGGCRLLLVGAALRDGGLGSRDRGERRLGASWTASIRRS